jgi:hypothetical protein
MKVTLDLDKLLEQGRIDQAEYDKFSQLSARDTSALAFNILVGFGVVAVSGATLALLPNGFTALVLGLIIWAAGYPLVVRHHRRWLVAAHICVTVGALMFGGGVIALGNASTAAFILVAAAFSAAGVLAHSGLLIVLAVLALSAAVGARTGYFHASYFLGIDQPLMTIGLFTVLSVATYQWSRRLPARFERLAIIASRTGVFLVNFGFWVGSLWGERQPDGAVLIADWVFAIAWALALALTGIWGWRRNRRWVVNVVAVFGAIHFYTQWFERLGASAGSVLAAGLLALGFALGLRALNARLAEDGRREAGASGHS